VRLSISIQIYDQYGGRLSVGEELDMGTMDFMEMAGILGEFHKTAERIKRARGQEER
jgi:hypothetical protein